MPEVISQSAEQTKKLGEILGQELLAGRQFRKKAIVIGLEGQLGSGKTIFIQGLAKGLGMQDRITSPTFVIMRRYRVPKNVIARSKATKQSRRVTTGLPRSLRSLAMTSFYHIDCYRIQRAKELLDLGFQEIISQPKNIMAIEWAERVRRILPKNTLWIKFQHFTLNKRRIIL